MICAKVDNGPPGRLRSWEMTARLMAALAVGLILASSSVALSFEPSADDQANPSEKATAKKPRAGTGAGPVSAKNSAKQRQKGSVAGPGKQKGPVPERPVKVITSPTMTSADLDRLIAQHLAKNDPKVQPAALTSDVEFVRRIYFDVIGRPPTPDQVESFLRDRSKDKRARLVDLLLNTPEYARNWAKYWRDVVMFHATQENLNRVRFDEMENWLTKRFQANSPWDEVVSELITATGRNDENGAVAFALAHETRPVEMAGEVSRIFMGVQIQCAQCHDHKTDSWKRVQFHEFAAFFAGVRPRQVAPAAMGERPVISVVVQGPRRYTMPELDNPAKQIPIAPRFFLTSSRSISEAALSETLEIPERRALAASYVTGQDNPWFAKAYINRVWYALMGEAFFEPIDDIGPERTPKAPEVIDPLASQWQKGGYDMRWLFRTILNTEAYQRRVRSTANAAGKTPFASSCPSRLRADQVYDALMQALAVPVDENNNMVPPNPNGRGPGQGNTPKNAQKALARLGDPKRLQNMSLGAPERLLKKAQGKGAGQKAAQAAGLASQVGKKAAAAARPGGQRVLFDRLFGVDPSVANEDIVGTIPQALFLMNSPLISNRIQARPGTFLGQILNTAPNERAALGALYLRVLSRQPTKDEVEICGRYMASVGNRAEAFEDIYWSLINTTEFVTRR
jgi:Protein of unknown function (DUF1549)/Protein of unknown function (DUF1553)